MDPDALKERDAGLIEKLKLTEGGYLNRAAILLFHPDPQTFVSGAFAKIGFFRSESDLAYHDEVGGDLFAQVRQTLDVLHAKYLKAAITYEDIQRIERYPVPRAALREAILNALVHRDYSVPAPVQIRVYEDRLTIWNPAVRPDGWSLKKLLGEHASLPFNPWVANAFFRAGEIEAWGRGIDRIFQACREAGTPRPQLHYEPNELRLTFRFSSAHLDNIRGGEGLNTEPDEKWGAKWGEKCGEKWGEKTAATRLRIAQAMRRNPRITIVELAAQLGVASTSGIEKHLKAMRDAGCIRRAGPAKGGRWEVLP